MARPARLGQRSPAFGGGGVVAAKELGIHPQMEPVASDEGLVEVWFAG